MPPENSRRGNPSTAQFIRRSFDTYYRDRERTRRMDVLNSQFVQPGGLTFDIGAHVGDRTGSFLRLGSKVVALEPQPELFRALGLLYGRNPDVALQRVAAGAVAASSVLHVNAHNLTVSTLSSDFIEAASTAAEWHGERWDQTIKVDVTTLDALIDLHGMPDFVKIDVEGHELEVLRGLSAPVRALCFEFTTICRSVAYDCLELLQRLGDYRFNFSLGEEHCLRHHDWLDGRELAEELSALSDAANSGDVFARLSP